MPLIINPDLMIVDAEEGAGRVAGPRTDTTKMSAAEAEAASIQAGKELGLTDAQLQEGITDPSQLTKLPGETNTQFNARVTTAYKDFAYKPELTDEQTAAGATVRWVRTGASGVGEYRIVYPIGVGYNPITGAPTGINAFNFSSGVTGLAAPGSKIFQFLDGKMYYDGALFTGEQDNAKWVNGVKTAVASGTDEDGNIIWKPVSQTGLNNTGSSITGSPTTNVDVLKASLKGLGFSASIVDASSSFLNSLLKEGLDYDNATEIFLNSKTYTLKNGQTIESPFYKEYGYLNEGLTVPKTANELFNTVEGFKGVVDKYKLSSKYLTQDNLKLYVKNDVTVANLAERAATAQLRALEADPFQVNALIKLGYIGSAADLTDFYMDAKIGQQQLELNRQTGVFTAEALRRAKTGISTSADQISGFKQLTATLAAKGYNEAQIAQLASTGFENIGQELQPTTQLAQIYEKAGGTEAANAALTEDIQKSLLAEEFQGTASERRKRLSEQNVRAFQGAAGTTSSSLRQANVLGII